MGNEFKIGDRVIGVGYMSGKDIADMIGTVVGMGSGQYSVEFDEEFENGHDCSGNGSYGRCWYCDPDTIQHYEEDYEPLYSEDDIISILHI